MFGQLAFLREKVEELDPGYILSLRSPPFLLLKGVLDCQLQRHLPCCKLGAFHEEVKVD